MTLTRNSWRSAKAAKPMKRTSIQRKRNVAQTDSAVFDIVTAAGDRYLWPVKHMPEKDWQETVIAWAMHGDPKTKTWHCTTAQASQPGFFDLTILQPQRGVGLLVELKVRDRNGNAGKVRADQWEYISAAARCGLDVRLWQWPDDGREAWEALIGDGYVP